MNNLDDQVKEVRDEEGTENKTEVIQDSIGVNLLKGVHLNKKASDQPSKSKKEPRNMSATTASYMQHWD